MYKYVIVSAIIGICVGFSVLGESFTDINSPQYYGKTGIPAAYSALDANFALLEDATDGTVGTGVTATVTATETYGGVHKTVLTLADVPISVTDLTGTTNSCGGTQIYDFPAGEIYILGFMVDNFDFETNSVIDDGHGGDFAFGTTVGTGPDLTGTEIDMTDAKVSIDPIQTAVDAVTEFDDIGESRFDGTATAKDLYVNLLIDGGDIDADTTNTVDATVTIHWINLGDD